MDDAITQANITVMPNGLVSRKDAALFLGRKPKTLAEWKHLGIGPQAVIIRHRAFYRLTDLQAFVAGETA